MVKDYFTFETIRDRNGDVICYHVTAIGTIEKDGETRMRTDLGGSGDKKMAFGKLTVRGRDRIISLLLRETGSRIHWRSEDDQGPYCIISFAAREKHAEEIYNLNEGDRVLLVGRVYLRQPAPGYEDRLPELSITVSSSFLLGRRRRPQTMTSSIVPQKKGGAVYAEPFRLSEEDPADFSEKQDDEYSSSFMSIEPMRPDTEEDSAADTSEYKGEAE